MVHNARMSPSILTLPSGEICMLKSTIFHGMGVMGSESETVLGTVFNIFSKTLLQILPVFWARF